MVDKKIVEHVANLARIAITEEEKDSLAGQLSKIINYIDKLKNLNTDDIEPIRELHLSREGSRKDEPKKSSARQDILNNVPLRQKDYIKIPKVIE